MLVEIGGEFFEADDIWRVKQTLTPWVAELWLLHREKPLNQCYGPQHGSKITDLIERINAAKSRA